jgi:hypothetical protein
MEQLEDRLPLGNVLGLPNAPAVAFTPLLPDVLDSPTTLSQEASPLPAASSSPLPAASPSTNVVNSAPPSQAAQSAPASSPSLPSSSSAPDSRDPGTDFIPRTDALRSGVGGGGSGTRGTVAPPTASSPGSVAPDHPAMSYAPVPMRDLAAGAPASGGATRSTPVPKASPRSNTAIFEQGAYAQFNDTVPISRNQLAPAINGVVIAVQWSTVEQADGVFNWTNEDARLQESAAAGLKVVLDLNTAPAAAPAWITSNPAVQTITLLDTNPFHSTECQNLTGPVFWDSTYLLKKEAFIAAAGARYASNPIVVGVNTSFANWSNQDWSVPNVVGIDSDCGGVMLNQVQQWQAAGYTTQKMLAAGEQTIDTIALAFPAQGLKLAIHGTAAALDGTLTTLTQTILNYDYTKYPTRFFAQIDFLSALTPLATDLSVASASPNTDLYLYKLLNQFSPQIGFQMLSNATNNGGNCRLNGGTFPCPPQQVLQNVINIVDTYSPTFLEFANVDATNPALFSIIQGPGAAVALIATGADATGGPDVRVFNNQTGVQKFELFAYNIGFTGGVRVALGDVNGDGTADIIAGPGPGGGPEIKVFDGKTGQVIRDFMAFDPNFLGGVFMAAGDVNGDGLSDIIVGADARGGPEVKVFSGQDGSVLDDFMAYDPRFTGGVRVAVGDVNGDGLADIITAAGPGGGPEVRIFSGATGTPLQAFMAYDPNFAGGVYVAAGDVNGDHQPDIITGAGAGASPLVSVFSGANLAVLQSFLAFDPTFTGGVRVAARDVQGAGKADIITAPGPGSPPQVRVYDDGSSQQLDNFFAYNSQFLGGVFVG